MEATPARKQLTRFGSFRDVSALLGVTYSSVTNAAARELLPAAWFDALDKEARANKIEIDRDAFNWTRADTSSEAAA